MVYIIYIYLYVIYTTTSVNNAVDAREPYKKNYNSLIIRVYYYDHNITIIIIVIL